MADIQVIDDPVGDGKGKTKGRKRKTESSEAGKSSSKKAKGELFSLDDIEKAIDTKEAKTNKKAEKTEKSPAKKVKEEDEDGSSKSEGKKSDKVKTNEGGDKKSSPKKKASKQGKKSAKKDSDSDSSSDSSESDSEDSSYIDSSSDSEESPDSDGPDDGENGNENEDEDGEKNEDDEGSESGKKQTKKGAIFTELLKTSIEKPIILSQCKECREQQKELAEPVTTKEKLGLVSKYVQCENCLRGNQHHRDVYMQFYGGSGETTTHAKAYRYPEVDDYKAISAKYVVVFSQCGYCQQRQMKYTEAGVDYCREKGPKKGLNCLLIATCTSCVFANKTIQQAYWKGFSTFGKEGGKNDAAELKKLKKKVKKMKKEKKEGKKSKGGKKKQ